MKENLIKFLIDNNALIFGDFTTKSGRKTPYFINTGNLNSGEALKKLSLFYSEFIYNNFENYNVIFGPAYKGIPLATAISIELYNKFNKQVFFSSNRKELKDHGDKGILLGKKLIKSDNVIIVDDVITAGTSIIESIKTINKFASGITGALILVDRKEIGYDGKNALFEIYQKYGIKVSSIINIFDIYNYLKDKNLFTNYHSSIQDYMDKYCIKN